MLKPLKETVRDALLEALDATSTQVEAAKVLEISARRLNYMMKKMNIPRARDERRVNGIGQRLDR